MLESAMLRSLERSEDIELMRLRLSKHCRNIIPNTPGNASLGGAWFGILGVSSSTP